MRAGPVGVRDSHHALSSSLVVIVIGLIIVSTCGILTQATSNSFVATTAKEGTSSAVGLYVTCFYIGGTFGGWLPGIAYENRRLARRACAGRRHDRDSGVDRRDRLEELAFSRRSRSSARSRTQTMPQTEQQYAAAKRYLPDRREWWRTRPHKPRLRHDGPNSSDERWSAPKRDCRWVCSPSMQQDGANTRVARCRLPAMALIAAPTAAFAAEQAAFDGTWSVSVETTKGFARPDTPIWCGSCDGILSGSGDTRDLR